jgi:SPP1 gp7 family putative phage head morphogenesis protein
VADLNKDKEGGADADELVDLYLWHGIYLERYKTHEANKLLGILDEANTQISLIIAEAKRVETKEKYRRVAAEIKRVKNKLSEKLYGRFERDGMDLIEEETAFVERAVSRAVYAERNIVFDFELPAAKKVWAAAAFGSYSENGKETFESYLNGLTEDLYKVWDGQVRAGYLTGVTAGRINRAVLGSVKDLEPGMTGKLRKSLERNTRTMIASLAETARDAVYRENQSIFDGCVYVAALDTRTCPVCGDKDGKVYPNPETAPKLPAHHNCRCLYLPRIKGREGLDVAERASTDGPVDGKVTWRDWLARQSDERQRDILGPTRHAMYKAGADTGGFVTDNRTIPLSQLKEKNRSPR